MKVKHFLILAIIGILGVTIGAFFRIQHYPGGSIIMAVSLLIELLAGLLIIIKLITYKGGGDFLNS